MLSSSKCLFGETGAHLAHIQAQSLAKYDFFLTRDLGCSGVQVRMAERSKALRSGRSLLL